MNKAYAIIPARYASTRFPAKPLAEIGGKPLFWHVYMRAKQADIFEEVWLATDDERIEKKAEEAGIPFIHTRKEHQSGTDRVREAVNILGLDAKAVIANIQGDEPFITREMFVKLLEPFQSSRCESATLGVILDEEKDRERIFSPNQVKIALAQNGEALYFPAPPFLSPVTMCGKLLMWGMSAFMRSDASRLKRWRNFRPVLWKKPKNWSSSVCLNTVSACRYALFRKLRMASIPRKIWKKLLNITITTRNIG